MSVGSDTLSGAASGAALGSVAGPWGCVCAGTRVITNLGEFKNIEELVQEDGIIGCDGTKYIQQPIIAFQDPAKKECLEIETRLGHILQCSTDHPIYSSGQGRALRLSGGDRTRVKRYKFVDADKLILGDNIGLINELPIWGTKEMDNPYLVGMCIGDGTYGKDRGIRLCSADPDTWNYIESNDLGYQIDKNQYTKYNREFRSYRLTNRIDSFRELGIYEQTKLNKRLPDNIHIYNKESICKLIAGLIDTDGCVSFNPKKPKNSRILFFQSNIELINQVREQLVKLGIHSSLKTNKEKKSTFNGYITKEAYILIIKDKYSVINFYNNISLNISYKKENLKGFYEYIKNIATRDHKEINNICADRITKITPIGVKDIYNLEAGGSNTYIANLIITHNTVIGGVVGGAAGLIGGLSKKKKRDEAAKNVHRPDYQIPQEVFQNQAMYEAMAKSSRVPGQANIENQIGQNTAQSINASQKAAGSSADALASVGKIQQNALNQYGQLGQMGAEFQQQNIDKLAAARGETADYRQQAFDYNKNQPYQIAFGQNQKLQDQNRQDNQNITNDVQALGMIADDQYDKYGNKKKKSSSYSPFSSTATSPTYN